MYDGIIDWESLKKLPIAARWDIIDLIEESIELDEAQEPYNGGYTYETDEELEILNERLEHDRQNPEGRIAWEDLKAQLLNRKNNEGSIITS